MYKSKKITRVGNIVKVIDNGIEKYNMDAPEIKNKNMNKEILAATNSDNNTSASVEANPMLGDAFRVYKELSDGVRHWITARKYSNNKIKKAWGRH